MREGQDLATPKAGMVAAGIVLEVIIEDAGLSVAKGDLYQRKASQYRRILFLHHHPRSPFGVFGVNDPVSDL